MLPSLFISHGSPMHALQPGAAGEAWKAIAERLPRPKAILIASAHWDTDRPAVYDSVGSRIVAGSSSSRIGAPVSFSVRASNGTAASTPWRA